MGDFNLDVKMELRPDYLYKNHLSQLTDFVTTNNLVQLVNFVTWTRTINGIRKESTLNHIYTDNDTLVNEVTFKEPTFGDHNLVIAKLPIAPENNSVSFCKRNWHKYSPRFIIENIVLKPVNSNCNVQSQWNALEHYLVTAADHSNGN